MTRDEDDPFALMDKAITKYDQRKRPERNLRPRGNVQYTIPKTAVADLIARGDFPKFGAILRRGEKARQEGRILETFDAFEDVMAVMGAKERQPRSLFSKIVSGLFPRNRR